MSITLSRKKIQTCFLSTMKNSENYTNFVTFEGCQNIYTHILHNFSKLNRMMFIPFLKYVHLFWHPLFILFIINRLSQDMANGWMNE